MAGAMRKMGIYLGLVEDSADEQSDEYASEYGEYREYDEYPAYDGAEREPVARRESSRARPVSTASSWAEPEPAASPVSPASRTAVAERPSYLDYADRPPVRETTIAPEADRTRAALAQIVTLHPRTYNEARVIGEHFRDGTPVIMNLTEMDDSDAKRLVDFAAGITFGLRGSIDRVTNRVFLLSPQHVNVTAEDKARLAEGGFFNQS